MSKRTLTTLWIVTGLVALVLAALTIRLAARARNQIVVNSTVYLVGEGVSVGLHEGPDPASPIIAVLVRGSAVTVLDFATEGGQMWYYIQKEAMTPGWVPAEHVRRSSP